MLDLDLLAPQPAHELHIVVPRDAERRTRSHHIANNADSIENMSSTIDQIAQEDRAPSRGVPPALVTPRGVRIRQSEPLPPCLFEQHPQFVGTAMQVAEDIERTRLVLLVVPQRARLISISSDPSRMWTYRNPSFSSPLTPRLISPICRRITCGPKSRSGRLRLRSWHTRSGVFITMATAKQWYLRACSTKRFRSSARTLVASTTVSLPRASRFSIM